MNVNPPPLRRDSFDRVHDGLRSLLGRPLTRVEYAAPAEVAAAVESTGLLHDGGFAVQLAFGGPAVRVDWAQLGFDEGVAVQLDEPLPATWMLVEHQPDWVWSKAENSTLEQVEVVWHRPGDPSVEVALGLAFRLSRGFVVAVTVGEVVDGGLSYLPDELVVVFDERVAQEYFEARSSHVSHVS